VSDLRTEQNTARRKEQGRRIVLFRYWERKVTGVGINGGKSINHIALYTALLSHISLSIQYL
jgi:hypothetical protein